MTTQEHKELLLRVVLRVAASQLLQGGLMPFAATLGTHRNVEFLVPKGVKKEVTPEELESYWVQQLRTAVAENECSAICYCAELRNRSVDGAVILVLFAHIESAGGAEDRTYPYHSIEGGGIAFAAPNISASTALVLT